MRRVTFCLQGGIKAFFGPTMAALLGAFGCAQHSVSVPSGLHSMFSQKISLDTELGAVVGNSSDGAETFYGIPFAKPPVGDLRWHAPVPFGAWNATGPLSAREPKDKCPQQANPFAATADASGIGGSEDCLYLNIHRPATRPRALPVMVWIHGGSFTLDDGANYDGSKLAAEQGLIVVTINYRLSALGFLAHPALAASTDGSAAGNYALQDQVLALQWVHDHIASYGGDPSQVTIFGESAGAYSACVLLATPKAQGLFARAIMESGSCRNGGGSLAARTEVGGQLVAKNLGCDQTKDVGACLRGLSAEEVTAAGLAAGVDWDFTLGAAMMPELPGDVIAAGRFTRVPLLIGANHDENRLFQLLNSYSGSSLDEGGYSAQIKQSFKKFAPEVLAEYPAAMLSTPALTYAAMRTDSTSACPTAQFGLQLGALTPTYVYEFNDPNAVSNLIPTFSVPSLGAAHMSEIAYIFHTWWFVADPGNFDSAQSHLAHQMATYWGNFAKTGNPNGAGLPTWAADTAAEPFIAELAPDGIGPAQSYDKDHHCAFWN